MPRTQSALLEAMAERQVTVDGDDAARCPIPSSLLATENPIDLEGTFPLPEAQLDRFAIRTALGYPDADQEVRILLEQRQGHPLDDLGAAVTVEEARALRSAVGDVYVDELLLRWIVDLVRATREIEGVLLGASVRGSLALQRVAAARALLEGRDYVRPQDVEALFLPVLGHRLRLDPTAFADAGRRDARGAARARPRRRPRARAGAARGRRGASPRPSRRRAVSAVAAPAAPFPLVPRFQIEGLSGGVLQGLRRGRGSEPVATRPYRTGDSTRTIDWAASARLSAAHGDDRFVVREYRAEEAPRVVVVQDLRPEMGCTRPTLPWLHKPAAVQAALAAIARERARRRARGSACRRGATRGGDGAALARRARRAAGRRQALDAPHGRARADVRGAAPAAARISPRARSCSSSPTSSSRCPPRSGARRSRAAGTSCPSSCRTRSGRRASPPSAGCSCPSPTRATAPCGRSACAHARRGGSRPSTRSAGAQLLLGFQRAGLDPVLVETSSPAGVRARVRALGGRTTVPAGPLVRQPGCSAPRALALLALAPAAQPRPPPRRPPALTVRTAIAAAAARASASTSRHASRCSPTRAASRPDRSSSSRARAARRARHARAHEQSARRHRARARDRRGHRATPTPACRSAPAARGAAGRGARARARPRRQAARARTRPGRCCAIASRLTASRPRPGGAAVRGAVAGAAGDLPRSRRTVSRSSSWLAAALLAAHGARARWRAVLRHRRRAEQAPAPLDARARRSRGVRGAKTADAAGPPRGPRAARADARAGRRRRAGRPPRAALAWGRAAAVPGRDGVGRRQAEREEPPRDRRARRPALPLADARRLAPLAGRTAVVRWILAAARRRAARCSRCTPSRTGRTTNAALLPAGSRSVVVLDLSASLSSDTFSREGATIARLADSGGRMSLVVFSDLAYEAMPPGTPAVRAAADRPALHAAASSRAAARPPRCRSTPGRTRSRRARASPPASRAPRRSCSASTPRAARSCS